METYLHFTTPLIIIQTIFRKPEKENLNSWKIPVEPENY